MITTALEKNVLVFFSGLPVSLGKSAHMLVLKNMREVGWNPTVITVELSDYEAHRPPILEWNGVEVHSIAHSGSAATRLSNKLYRLRTKKTLDSHALENGSRGGDSKRGPRMGSALANLPLRALRPLTAALNFPDKFRYYGVSEALRLADRLHLTKNFQAVISLYSPFAPHFTAKRFADEHDLPWIALQKDYYSRPDELTKSFLDKATNGLKRRLDFRTISRCDALLPVNENMAEYYRKLVPNVTTKPLTHCFDEDDFASPEEDEATEAGVFRVLSLGFINRLDHYGLGVYFQALGELLNEGAINGKDFKARFVGHGGDIARSYARSNNCESILETSPPLSHDEAMRELRRAGCLFFQQVHLGSRRRLPEFLASRKPILVFPEDPGAMSDRVFREYGAAAITNSKDEIKETLLGWYRTFKAKGKLDLTTNEELVSSFGARRKALELGDVLRSVTETVTDTTLAERRVGRVVQ